MRNASLQDLVTILSDQQGRKIDVVAPASTLRSENGVIVVTGTEQQITLDGVTTVDGRYLPTEVFDGQVATRLGIDTRYLRKLREHRVDLYDANVNGWLHGNADLGVEADTRSFLLRAFRGDEGGTGVSRALLSNRFDLGMDHFDTLTAVLDGVRQSGVNVDITRCDLTETKMYVKVAAPEVAALAPELLKGYKSPYTGLTGEQNPLVFAGFVFSNSEVGMGALSIVPELTVQICTNGMTLTKQALRKTHIGSKMDAGVVSWSADTQRKQMELITAQARDAVATFLDVEFVKSQIVELERKAGVPVRNAPAVIENVGKSLNFTEDFTASVLDFFIQGGQLTSGGVLQAVTAAVQQVDDADAAYEISGKAVEAMELVAALV